MSKVNLNDVSKKRVEESNQRYNHKQKKYEKIKKPKTLFGLPANALKGVATQALKQMPRNKRLKILILFVWIFGSIVTANIFFVIWIFNFINNLIF